VGDIVVVYVTFVNDKEYNECDMCNSCGTRGRD
jgi:hypothetical protein